MRNIFVFIRSHFTFISFLLLQALSLYLIVTYSKYHQAAFGSKANLLTGSINSKFNKVEYYLDLKRTNDSLVKANEELYNRLRINFNVPDSSDKTVIDSIKIDSIIQYRRFRYRSAKVVSNAVSSQSNYLVLTGPNVKTFRKDMGIVDVNNRVVGVITEVDGDYAIAMSLLHKDSRLSGKLYKGGETGTIIWNGEQPNILLLTNIPKSAKVAKGDSVITSGFSAFFPKGLLVGRVIKVRPETTNNNYQITFRSAADFYNVEYVYAIESADAAPIKKLTDKAKASVN